MKFRLSPIVLILVSTSIIGGCATDTMTKADLVNAFDKCGIMEEYSLTSTGTCMRTIAGSGVIPCDMTVLDPVTKATLLKSGKATRKYINYGTVLPIKTKDGAEASVAIDQNTGVILYSHGDHDRMYLAGSSWMSGDYIVGLKSRILGWGKVIKISEIDGVELYTEMTRKRSNDQSCLQNH